MADPTTPVYPSRALGALRRYYANHPPAGRASLRQLARDARLPISRVSYWASGRQSPAEPWRRWIAAWTRGAVKADDWKTAEEREIDRRTAAILSEVAA